MIHPSGWRMHALGGSTLSVGVEHGWHTAMGMWHSLRLAPGWDHRKWLVGTPRMEGRQVDMIGPWQPAEDAEQRNPVHRVWQGVWVPDDYSERTVSWWAQPRGIWPDCGSTVWVRDGSTPPNYEWACAYTYMSPHNLLRIPIAPSGQGCYADCDGNGALSVDDFVCFINEFAAAQGLPLSQQMQHYANCDGSTAPPVLTVDDFICFINEVAQGCV